MTKRQQLLRLLKDLPDSEPGIESMSNKSDINMFSGYVPTTGQKVTRGYVIIEGNFAVKYGTFDAIKDAIESDVLTHKQFLEGKL